MTNWEQDIDRVFCPKSERERNILLIIARESQFIGRNLYSHTLVGLKLYLLTTEEGYYTAKIQEVVRMFGLDNKGWNYILSEEYEQQQLENNKNDNICEHILKN